MSSILRFDEWQDSNGNPVYDGSGGPLATPAILQVLGVNQDSTVNAGTSGTEFDIPGFNVTITPGSASSKIMVFVQLTADPGTTNSTTQTLRLRRNGTLLSETFARSDTFDIGMVLNFLDEPATTSSVNYKASIESTINTRVSHGRNITVMEVGD